MILPKVIEGSFTGKITNLFLIYLEPEIQERMEKIPCKKACECTLRLRSGCDQDLTKPILNQKYLASLEGKDISVLVNNILKQNIKMEELIQ